MRGLFRYSVLAIICMVIGSSVPVRALEPTNSGLLISPPRYSMNVSAGEIENQKFTVANYTSHALDVTLSVETFTVANLSYQYQIKPVANPWLYFDQTVIHLDTGESQVHNFTLDPPPSSSPGGVYYLIVASAVSKHSGLTTTLQVAAPLYITINGTLDTSSRLGTKHSIGQFVFGDQIPFQIDVENNGNVHYQVDVKGKLSGLSSGGSTVATQHILLPGTTRRFSSSIPSPILPGLYQATYGYSSASSGDVIIKAWVIYLPPWSIALFILVIWAGVFILRTIRRRKLS